MNLFMIGLVAFLGLHSISILNRPWRDRMVFRLGESGWKGLYTVLSLSAFALLCYGYGLAHAASQVLYTPPANLRHLAYAVLLPVFPLMFSVYLPGHLKAKAKHPLLLATKLWATAHLLVNGNLADVLLFGGFLAWAVADRISVERRPPTPVVLGPHAGRNDLLSIVAGLAVYGLFVVWLHRMLIGVAPM
jgi:uncharacterized membrane protein